jgi:hypothetical protein
MHNTHDERDIQRDIAEANERLRQRRIRIETMTKSMPANRPMSTLDAAIASVIFVTIILGIAAMIGGKL